MNNYEKLVRLLKELFQLDQADLDFGIYRIMNQKRDEIEKFLYNDLLPQVKTSFEQFSANDKSSVQQELDKTIENAKSMGIDPDTVPKVIELKEKITNATDVTQLENEVFSLLHNFFNRYYHKGDFISMRRYKKDVYAIPYEGEEVKLHYANRDQYFIKTSEYFKNYSFKLSNNKSVNFILTEAQTEQNNNNEINGKERRFKISKEDIPNETNNSYDIYFSYEICDERQDSLNNEAIDFLVHKIPPSYLELLEKRPTEKNKNRTLLEKKLKDYTSKNTFDYFIHKDLGSFLRRELDFFIKNEVLFIDDINIENEISFTKQLSKIKSFKTIAKKIIKFLEQLENFQQKIWLKKKFVVETNYCITLDLIPKELYPEIIINNEQIDEWINLFSINEINTNKESQSDLFNNQKKISFSIPLKPEFLEANKYLVLDTKFFSEVFKTKLLASFNNIDAQLNGVLINSENFQGLNLISEKYKNEINCIYIDPPYNTGDDGFNYKDNFKSSSWLSMLSQVNEIAYSLLSDDGAFFASCDENEMLNFGQILTEQFGKENHVETITWNKRVPKNDKGIGNIHEYIYLFAKNQKLRRSYEKSFVMRKDAIDDIYNLISNLKKSNLSIANAQKELKKFYKKQGYDRGITLYCELNPKYEIWGKINMAWPNAKTEGPRYTIINPLTNKPCPVPNKGWRWKEDTFKDALQGDTYKLPDGSLMQGRIWFANDEKTQPSSITYLKDVESFLLRSIISLKSDGSIQLDNLGLSGSVDYPKPPKLIEWLCYSINIDNGFFLDYFAGSGTTSESIISLNRGDNGNRKYILMDMGDHFNSALKPRTQKAIYSNEWKNGKPISRNGISQFFKYHILESYEDSLNNLEFKRTQLQEKSLLESAHFNEEYLLSYLLDTEADNSKSLLDLETFKNPFDYKLRITRNNESKNIKIDLPETFNYLIGLNVESMDIIKDFKVIIGKNQREEKILVIWRDVNGNDNNKLDDFFLKQQYNTRDSEFDRIYVNGDNNLENLKVGDEKWKVVLIEEEFKKRMFDIKEI
ncbi:MAG: site-specific DNA-methyltransferase [Bacteroidales bacterium]|nr:site-specific DNA-methyltransferase [Bacteroidales bacterium]